MAPTFCTAFPIRIHICIIIKYTLLSKTSLKIRCLTRPIILVNLKKKHTNIKYGTQPPQKRTNESTNPLKYEEETIKDKPSIIHNIPIDFSFL